ncbi:hypothetical protein GRI62_01540 [Erythrobacter arachoides]|uniref:Uncharacterized protein n=1 Tax=Aurantiacibacter arachoides TaxID=1850444 RepID=A0A844ZX25_9SPHN|nr:hypothetical protein [Aurantiacibacter arachoides]MXO92288.1 hypothetical protein [Aurantiacibacter arachoides]
MMVSFSFEMVVSGICCLIAALATRGRAAALTDALRVAVLREAGFLDAGFTGLPEALPALAAALSAGAFVAEGLLAGFATVSVDAGLASSVVAFGALSAASAFDVSTCGFAVAGLATESAAVASGAWESVG